MVFSSLIFLLAFLPLCLIFYYAVPGITGKNIVLLIFSLIFYSWGGPGFTLVMLVDTLVCYIGARLIASQIEKEKGHAKLFLVVTITVTLLILGVFKYLNFFLKGVRLFSGWPTVLPDIALPIGISFYTFQLISYVADVYRGDVRVQKNFAWLLLYTCMFYQCIAGPIVRYSQIKYELSYRKINVANIYSGIARFSIGLAKKAILANACSSISDTYLSATGLSGASSIGLILGLICYSLYIYLDFSAYSDMAIGLGLVMGFHLPENFNYPYISASITEFWRRWHISLSTFFRDYVYIPLGGNRVKPWRHILNLFIVWTLTGFWHGAHLNFIMWGIYYFVLLVAEKYIIKNPNNKIIRFIGHIYTPVLFVIGWMIFKYSDLHAMKTVIKGILTLNGNAFFDKATWLTLKANIFIIILSLIACTPLYRYIKHRITRHFQRKGKADIPVILWNTIYPAICLVLSIMALIGDSYNPFLYFQF